MTSPVDVANVSLDNIGARFSITSLNPPQPPPNAIVVARQYQIRIDALSRAAHWNCLRTQATLTLLKAAQGTPENPSGTTLSIPPVPWTYEYLYPPDCLKARFLVPNPPQASAVASPVLGAGTLATPWLLPEMGFPFQVATDLDSSGNRLRVILTNLEYAQLVYTARITDPDMWDPHYLNAACATLGAWLVNPLARNAQVLKEQIEIASGIVTQARISDGNEGTTSIDHVPDWMAVRGITGPEWFYGSGCYFGWDSMGFPGGAII